MNCSVCGQPPSPKQACDAAPITANVSQMRWLQSVLCKGGRQSAAAHVCVVSAAYHQALLVASIAPPERSTGAPLAVNMHGVQPDCHRRL